MYLLYFLLVQRSSQAKIQIYVQKYEYQGFVKEFVFELSALEYGEEL